MAGCEVCHGPGKAHSDAEEAAHGDDAATAAANKLVFSFRGSPRENWERCQQCHSSSHEQSEFNHRRTPAMAWVAMNVTLHTRVEAARDPNHHTLDGAQATFFSVPNLGAEVRWLNSSLLRIAAQALQRMPRKCGGSVRFTKSSPSARRCYEVQRLPQCTRRRWQPQHAAGSG